MSFAITLLKEKTHPQNREGAMTETVPFINKKSVCLRLVHFIIVPRINGSRYRCTINKVLVVWLRSEDDIILPTMLVGVPEGGSSSCR